MKVLAITIALLTSLSGLQAQTPLSAKTESPVLLFERYGKLPALSDEEYRKLTEKMPKNQPRYPLIKRKPPTLSPNARFGMNLSFGGINRSWALDGNAKDGYVLYADLNGNGDLSDEPALRFEKKDDTYLLSLSRTISESVDGHDVQYPLELLL